jgi:hypothetical protein
MKSRIMGWADYVAGMGEMRNAYKISVAETKGERQLGRTKHIDG